MPDLELSFRTSLYMANRDWPDAVGPLFCRWLPDGVADALTLNTGRPDVSLKVWFERHGFCQYGLVRFDRQRREVDPTIMARQAKLDAGPLYGSLSFRELTDDDVEPIRENRIGDPQYINFGKSVVKTLLPPLSRFLSILKVNYGQYWVAEVPEWDPRRVTLGNYCQDLYMRWSVDGGATWHDFRPTESGATFYVLDVDWSQYLTREDWSELAATCGGDYEPPVAATLLSESHRLLDEGQVKHAIFEGVSALEVGLRFFVKNALQGHARDLVTGDAKFSGMRLGVKMALISSLLPGIRKEDVDQALEVVEWRNNIIHEGKPYTENAQEKLRALHRIVAALLGRPGYKFPSRNGCTGLYPPNV